MAEEAPKRLGRGLAALIGDAESSIDSGAFGRSQKSVPIEFLRPNPRNPRKQFAEADIDDLANSIKAKGIIQPILVRNSPVLPGTYEIIAGERRWRAAQRSGLANVPVLIIEADDKSSLEIAIIENVQRSDLNAIEEAVAYSNLLAEFDYTQSDLASVVGKSRSHIANTIRLLKLPDDVKKSVIQGDLSAGHARAILNMPDPEKAARMIISDKLNVREVESLANKSILSAKKNKSARNDQKDTDTKALESALETVLGLSVKIKHDGKGGEISIKYKNLEQLDLLCQRLRE
jgi:ParB family transcriptional regulator, chromosome partitioning protein